MRVTGILGLRMREPDSTVPAHHANAERAVVYRVDRADDLDWLYGSFGDYLP